MLKHYLEKFTGFKVADYWHVEVFVAVPLVILWTVLLIIIAIKV